MGSRVTGRDPDGLAESLRREAAGERPMFSAALHEQILRGMPVKPATPAVIELAEPRVEGVGRSAWRQVSLTVAGAALVLAVVIVGAGPDPADGPPQRVGLVATVPADGSDAAATGDAAELGIERVPMFDELEAGVREGVSTLAATLLDVPEWRMLADFDAAGFLGADSAR
jgi:hypothetical protein